MTNLDKPISDIAQSLRSGETNFEALANEAMANRSDELGAYRHVDDDLVRAQARAADEALANGDDHGPLMGMPVSAKDLYGVPGFPVHAGSPNPLPDEFTDAGPVVSALLERQVVITGKTHTVEFAFGGIGTNPHLPTPTNPWDAHDQRVPGGSSSGAGVSLCEGSAVVALGTDTAGSVRIPAAWTGNVGVKTTAKRWSLDGIVPLSSTLDTPGILTRSMADALLAFAAIDGSEPVADDVDVAALTLGRCDQLFWDDLSPGVGEAVEGAISELAEAGAATAGLDLPEVAPTYDLFKQGGPVSIEFHRFLTSRLPEWFETLDPNVRARVGDAGELDDAEYRSRLDRMAEWSAAVDRRLAGVDALVAPTVAITPPTFDEVSTSDGYGPRNLLTLRNTSIANYLGLCALTLPVGLDDLGMPVGLMLMARGGHDERLLAIGSAIEHVLGAGRERLGHPPRVQN